MTLETKVCTKCLVNKPLEEFHIDHLGKGGRTQWCRPCDNLYHRELRKTASFKKTYKKYRQRNQKRIQEWQKEYRDRTVDHRASYSLQRRYNITLETKRIMWGNQNGVCFICGKHSPFEDMHLDHNHKTGKIRELLCGKCNLFLGVIENNPTRVFVAYKYLEHHDKI